MASPEPKPAACAAGAGKLCPEQHRVFMHGAAGPEHQLKALPVPGHGEHARSPALSTCPGWILTAGWAFHAPTVPFPSFCALLPRGKAARAEGQSGHSGADVVSAWVVGDRGVLNPNASRTGVTGGSAAGGQQK